MRNINLEMVRVTEAAAIAGRELDLAVLQALVNSGDIPFTYKDLEKWLNACAEIAVLTVQHERWRFAHDKLRDGLLTGPGGAAFGSSGFSINCPIVQRLY